MFKYITAQLQRKIDCSEGWWIFMLMTIGIMIAERPALKFRAGQVQDICIARLHALLTKHTHT